jgi:acyl-CoA thioesterase-2
MEDVASAFMVRRAGDALIGASPEWFGRRVFGGILLAQALSAASATAVAGDERRARSLHAYFLRAAETGTPLTYEVDTIRDGRLARTCAVRASQNGHPVLTMLCSFAGEGEGRAYELSRARDAPDPDALGRTPGRGPLEFAFHGPTPEREDGTRDSTHRAWMRIAAELPDDERVHDSVLAFLSDASWNGACPWDLSSPPDRSSMVSIDHAMWFHRPARADEWLYYDVHSLVHAGGHGTIRGVLHGSDRQIVCSMAQQLLFR